MRSGRWTKTLLRLYPRAWRERYGDEFVALIDESGLTWSAIADVIASAGTERVRAIIALANDRVDQTYAIKFGTPLRGREVLADFLAFNACVGLLMAALAAFGVPFPKWNTLGTLLLQWSSAGEPFYAMHPHRSERLTRLIVWLLAAVVLTGAGYLVGVALRNLGVPEPSTALFYSLVGTYFVSGAARVLYCSVRLAMFNSTWPGVYRGEAVAWKTGLWLVMVMSGLGDPGFEVFWPLVGIFWMTLQPALELTREGVARRRAFLDAVQRGTPIS
jgi:hypothetical protein